MLNVVTDRFELVMPPKIEASQRLGTALYGAKTLIGGRGRDVLSLKGKSAAVSRIGKQRWR